MFSLLLFLFLPAAAASPAEIGFLQAVPQGREVVATLDLSVEVAARLLALRPEEVTPLSLESRALRLRQSTVASGRLSTAQGDCEWGSAQARRHADTVRLTASAHCPGSATELRWDLAFLHREELPPAFELLAHATGAAEHLTLLKRGNETLDLRLPRASGWWAWLRAGLLRLRGTLP